MALNTREQELNRDVTVMTLEGDLDSTVAPTLHERLTDAGQRGPVVLVVDLTGAGFIDSSALGAFVTAVKRLRQAGGGFAVVCSEPAKRRIFEVVGLDRVFPVEATLDRALARVGRRERRVSRSAP